MKSERWRRVEDLFHQALARAPAERDAWIECECAGDAELRAEVMSLIASDGAAQRNFVGSRVEQAVAELGRPTSLEGRQIGPYRLIRELGRGGMGTVYLAARADRQYESEVAIKLVKPGLDTDFILRRFRRE